MGVTVTRGLVDWQRLTIRVSRVAWSPWMLMRGPWPVDHPDRADLRVLGVPVPFFTLNAYCGSWRLMARAKTSKVAFAALLPLSSAAGGSRWKSDGDREGV